jgi:hypothetical protein
MTRMRRIITDKAKGISVDPLYPRHPRSIIPYTDMKTALAPPTSSKGFWHGVLRRFETWNVPCFESGRQPPRRRVRSVDRAVVICFDAILKRGINYDRRRDKTV